MAMNKRLRATQMALAVILVFILQNLQSVEVHFLFFQGSLPLAVALLFAMILGALVVLAFGAGRILQLRLVARRARGRAMSVLPHVDSIRSVDDGVVGPITRKRSWWSEPGAWATYLP